MLDLPNDFENVGKLMGGFGSGIWRDRGADRCEDYHRIDLSYMARHGLLKPFWSGSLMWSRGGQRTGDIRYTVLPHALRLDYRTRPTGTTEWTEIREDVPFAWTGTAFGGQRRWLTCLSCGRRCRILYGGHYFRCRQCYRLTYSSQYESAGERALTRAQNVRIKLGGSGSMDDFFPPKPKGMHWRTYRRLYEQDQAQEEIWAAYLMAWLDLHR